MLIRASDDAARLLIRGRTTAIRSGIDHIVYQQLCTPDSMRSAMPDKSYLLNHDDY